MMELKGRQVVRRFVADAKSVHEDIRALGSSLPGDPAMELVAVTIYKSSIMGKRIVEIRYEDGEPT
jgi:hypothetical protein